MKANNYLFQTIDKSILNTIIHKEIAKQLWGSIKFKYKGFLNNLYDVEISRIVEFFRATRTRT